MLTSMLPEIGYIRINRIVGQFAVTQEEAEANRLKAKQAKKVGKKIKVGPQSPRPAIIGILPWSKSKLWEAVKNKKFPAPIKLSENTTAWDVRSIRSFMAGTWTPPA